MRKKSCRNCGVLKDEILENFSHVGEPRKNGTRHFRNTCKRCLQDRQNEARRRKKQGIKSRLHRSMDLVKQAGSRNE